MPFPQNILVQEICLVVCCMCRLHPRRLLMYDVWEIYTFKAKMFKFLALLVLVISRIKAVLKQVLAAVGLLSLQATGEAAPHKSVYKESGTIPHLTPSLRSTCISRTSTEPVRYNDMDWERKKSKIFHWGKVIIRELKAMLSYLHYNLTINIVASIGKTGYI